MLSVLSRTAVRVVSTAVTNRPSAVRASNTASRSIRAFCTSEEHAFTACLPFKTLPFKSVELDAETLPVQDTSEFGSRLYSTIEQCKKDGINSIILRVPMLYSHYIPVAG